MASYVLECAQPSCRRQYATDGFRLKCDGELHGTHGPALLKVRYSERQIQFDPEKPGIFGYASWLPAEDAHLSLPDHLLGRPYAYRSEGLARRLGLRNLQIAFSGYWPERGVHLLTRTFKEFECQAGVARFLSCYPKAARPPLIVASAGNTGNGYNLLTTLLGLPMFLVVPESALHYLVLPIETAARVLVVRSDYADAIRMAERLSARLGAQSDGGSRNVARRAGMATAFINAVVHPFEGTHHLFDHYFQAIGSGAGAIAAWEAVENLIADGRFGRTRTRIHISQNEPFAPIVDVWNRGLPDLDPRSVELAEMRIDAVTAKVLANRTPTYAPSGGMYDVLRESRGAAWKVSNTDLFEAARLFRDTEGVDIGPAAAVAVGALIQAVNAGEVSAADRVLLHVTGGGREIQQAGGRMIRVSPAGFVDKDDVDQAAEILSATPEVVAG